MPKHNPKELSGLAIDMHTAHFYDPLEVNDHVGTLLGAPPLTVLAWEPVTTIRSYITSEPCARPCTAAGDREADPARIWRSTGYSGEGHANGT